MDREIGMPLAHKIETLIELDKTQTAQKAAFIAQHGEARWDEVVDKLGEEEVELMDTPPETHEDLLALCDLIDHADVARDLEAFVRNVRAFAQSKIAAERRQFVDVEPPPAKDDHQ